MPTFSLESIVIATASALSSMPFEVNAVKVPAAAVELPITVPSIVPPSMSGVFTSGDVSVLFVSVSVVARPTRVSVAGGSVSVTLPLYAL